MAERAFVFSDAKRMGSRVVLLREWFLGVQLTSSGPGRIDQNCGGNRDRNGDEYKRNQRHEGNDKTTKGQKGTWE